MKKILLALLFLGFVTCEEAPNNFSEAANTFLDAIDGKEYTGKESFEGHTYKANGTIIADKPPEGITHKTLKFQNTRNNGSSKTEGVYTILRSEIEIFVGIIIENSGDTMRRTGEAPDENSITWANAPVFATK